MPPRIGIRRIPPRRWWLNHLRNKWQAGFGKMKRAHRTWRRANDFPPRAMDAFWRPFFTRVR